MSYFTVVTASNPVLYWTCQETGSGGPLWSYTDYGRYGYLSATVTSSARNYSVNLTGALVNSAPSYTGKGIYTIDGIPLWGSPAGQNISGCYIMPGSTVGPCTGPYTGSYTVKPELTATFQLSSSWSVEWWQMNNNNFYSNCISFIGTSGAATIGWSFGWPNGYYNCEFGLYWASGSTGSGSPPAITGSHRATWYSSAYPWTWPWLTPAGGNPGIFHFVLVWRGLGTLSGAANNSANFDIYINGNYFQPPTVSNWYGTGPAGWEPPTGSQIWWSNSVFTLGNTFSYGQNSSIAHVSVHDKALTATDIFDRYSALAPPPFTGSVPGESGSGSFNIASGSYMIKSVQRPYRNLVAPSSASGAGQDPRASKTDPGTN